MSRYATTCSSLVCLILIAISAASAQQVHIATPFPNVSNGFSEVTGFTGSLQGPGFSAHWGGFPTGLAPTPGVNPGGGLQGGFGFQGGGISGGLGFMASQGSNATAGTQTPMLTTMNGFGGVISDVSQSPFVISGGGVATGGVPWQQQVNGQIPRQAGRETSFTVVPPQYLGTPQQPSAVRSVAQIRREQQAAEQAQQHEAFVHLERGRAALADGKPGVARVFYQMALRRATGDLKQQVQDELGRLEK
jgi:hypothetical protein